MLAVFPDITGAIDRIEEIGSNDEAWEELDRLQSFLRDVDGYRRYDLQTDILRYFGFSESQLDQNVLSLSG